MSEKNLTINEPEGLKLSFRKIDDLISLTDLWRVSGSIPSQQPKQWLRKEGTQFVDYISKNKKGDSQAPLKTIRGRNGGTYAHWQIALAYAKYLSPELHTLVNQAFKDRVEEEQNPELAIDRGIDRAKRGYERKGKNPRWINKRLISKGVRGDFTDTLLEKGCDNLGIGLCTNSQYIELFGGKAHEIKERMGLSPGASLRDNLNMVDLAQIILAESMAIDRIEKDDAEGNWSCNKRSKLAAKSVREAVENFNKPAELAAEQARKNFFDNYGPESDFTKESNSTA